MWWQPYYFLFSFHHLGFCVFSLVFIVPFVGFFFFCPLLLVFGLLLWVVNFYGLIDNKDIYINFERRHNIFFKLHHFSYWFQSDVKDT